MGWDNLRWAGWNDCPRGKHMKGMFWLAEDLMRVDCYVGVSYLPNVCLTVYVEAPGI